MTTPVASLGILASSILATGHLGQCSHASMRRALVHSCRGNNRLVRSSSPPSPPRSLAQTAELNVAYSTKAGDSYCSLSPECSLPLYVGKHWLVPKSCLKDGGVPKSPCSCHWQPWCPSAGTLSIDVGSYRGCHRHPNCAHPCASGRAPWPSGPLTARSKRNTACRFSSATTMSDSGN
jgi:hypothetical protein